MNTTDKQPLLTPILRWFMLAMVLANISSGMYGFLLPLYVAELGASVAQIGLVFSITSIAALALQVLGGWISDSIGRLRAIAIGSVGGLLGYLAMLLAPSWEWMLLAISINQIPFALVGPSFGAFIAENSTQENRGRVYGVTDAVFQITGILGPPLGGLLAGRLGYRPMFLVALVLYGLAAGLRIWMAQTMRPPTDRRAEKLTLRSLGTSLKAVGMMIVGGGVVTWIFITDGIRDTAFRLSSELQPLYLEQVAGISVEQIGILGSVFSFAMMLVPVLSGRLSDRFGERVPITGGFLLVCLAFVIFLNVSSFLGFAATWVIFGFGVGILSPAYQSLISKVVPHERLGVFSGFFQSSVGVISLPAPWIGAQLWERYSPRLPFTITAGAALLTIVPIWLKFKVPDEDKGPPLAV